MATSFAPMTDWILLFNRWSTMMTSSLLSAPMELSDTELDAVAAGASCCPSNSNTNTSSDEGGIVVNAFSNNQNAGGGAQQGGGINVEHKRVGAPPRPLPAAGRGVDCPSIGM